MEEPTPPRLSADEIAERIPSSPRVLIITLWAILALLLLYTLYFARSIAVPIALAGLTSLVLAPVVRTLARVRIPPPLGAALLMLCVVSAAGYGVAALAEPAAAWVERVPEGAREIERKLRFLRDPVEKVNQATEQVEQLSVLAVVSDQPQVVVAPRSWTERVLGQAPGVAATALVTMILLYLLLATPDGFLGKLVSAVPTLHDKKRVVAAARAIQAEVSRYLVTISAINAVFGLAVGVALYLVGAPNPALWGVLAAVTNFVPYLGAWALAAVLAAVGMLTFDDPLQMFLPVAVFVALQAAETYLLTPFVLGRRHTLNPVVVLLSLLFWSWIWGVPGGLIAVPLLAATKIAMQRITPLEPLARFLD